MLHVHFNTYSNYVTDSLYQWDLNQDLVINGLNLTTAPEIHFANAIMDKAIVKQATLEGGVVTVRIPNSLLQEALTIKAYVGIYEGETFKVVETIEIPIIAKPRPADYQIEDSDEEIYSFKALENKINNLVAGKLFTAQTVTLEAASWDGQITPGRIYYRVEFPGVTADPTLTHVISSIIPDLAMITEGNRCVVSVAGQGDGFIMFEALNGETPTIDIDVSILVIGV